MEITITASKADVYAEVDIITAYIGGKNGKYDTIPTLDADHPLLDSLWQEAAAWAAASLGAAASADKSTDSQCSLAIEAFAGRPAAILEPLLREALARRIIGHWLQICGCGSDQAAEQAQNSLDSLKKQIVRKYPARRAIPPF